LQGFFNRLRFEIMAVLESVKNSHHLVRIQWPFAILMLGCPALPVFNRNGPAVPGIETGLYFYG
jgi:hypothetical protein